MKKTLIALICVLLITCVFTSCEGKKESDENVKETQKAEIIDDNKDNGYGDVIVPNN